MCEQPPFLLIAFLHFGQACVFALIQLKVCESLRFFSVHCCSIAQLTGKCASSPHWKQNSFEHAQRTLLCAPLVAITASSQPARGHHLTRWCSLTNERTMKRRSLPCSSGGQSSCSSAVGSVARQPSPKSGHGTSTLASCTLSAIQTFQHTEQNKWPQAQPRSGLESSASP